MEKIHYKTGELVQLNDEVRVIKKVLFSKRSYNGKVIYLPQYDQPVAREANDYGVSIKTDCGSELWCDATNGELSNSIIFSKRGA